jgi:hypothetical protein
MRRTTCWKGTLKSCRDSDPLQDHNSPGWLRKSSPKSGGFAAQTCGHIDFVRSPDTSRQKLSRGNAERHRCHVGMEDRSPFQAQDNCRRRLWAKARPDSPDGLAAPAWQRRVLFDPILRFLEKSQGPGLAVAVRSRCFSGICRHDKRNRLQSSTHAARHQHSGAQAVAASPSQSHGRS